MEGALLITILKVAGTFLGGLFLSLMGWLIKKAISSNDQKIEEIKIEVQTVKRDYNDLENTIITLKSEAITQKELDRFKDDINKNISDRFDNQHDRFNIKLEAETKILTSEIKGLEKGLDKILSKMN